MNLVVYSYLTYVHVMFKYIYFTISVQNIQTLNQNIH